MAQDDVDKFLSEEQQLESRRLELIKDLQRQKEAAIKAFDEKLARLGHHDGAGSRRSHHRKGPTAQQPDTRKGDSDASGARRA